MTKTTDIAPLAVDLEEAARLLQVGRSTIFSLARAGRIPTVRVGARRRVPIAALEKMLAEAEAPAR